MVRKHVSGPFVFPVRDISHRAGEMREFDIEVPAPVDGYLPVGAVVPDPARLSALAATPQRRQWWIARVRECYPLTFG